MRRFSAYVKAAIGDQNQRDFAQKVGVTQPVISSWVNGTLKTFPRPENILKLAHATGISHVQLINIINGEEKPTDKYEYVKYVIGELDFVRASEISVLASQRVKQLVDKKYRVS
ncbi:MAG: helix-turn-helix transcriptional regulator [Synechococcaceae cyanobacterium SM2_3_2]|nr:helix-turn-helix transcriptional regulator [Synechococcaceae cyanobacterium SM2_3_2]